MPAGPTADTGVLLGYARALLSRIWEPGTAYHKAGVVLDGLESPGIGQQLPLFGPAPTVAPQQEQRKDNLAAAGRPALMASLDALNQRFGRGAVRLASAVPSRGQKSPAGNPARAPWEGKAQWRSPAFTTRLEDLLLVN
ncbi:MULTISPECIES: DUF4113 domain-containing protein [Hymenobacter]|uniref:DUF4113 domain-containing protein n=1 Tax=Hymenobacter TaxID=89966 RepID=UPI0031E7070C